MKKPKLLSAYTAFEDKPPYINITEIKAGVRVTVRGPQHDGGYGPTAEIVVPRAVWVQMMKEVRDGSAEG